MDFGIPIAIHADGTNVLAVGKKSSKHMDTISWTSLLSPAGSAVQNYFVMAFMFQALCITGNGMNTMEDLWQHLTWSLAAAYRGVHPDRDPHGRLFTEEDGVWYSRAGKALAATDGVSEGYFLVLWTIKCDLDYVAKRLRLAIA